MAKTVAPPNSVRNDAPRDAQARVQVGVLLALVALNIALQLVNASLIKVASGFSRVQIFWITGVLAVVAALSVGRFAVWAALHKRFPVSLAYPASALFFPCLVAVAAAFGERVSFQQILGACLVTCGVVMLLRRSNPKSNGSRS